MICPKCNNEFDENAGACPNCGFIKSREAEDKTESITPDNNQEKAEESFDAKQAQNLNAAVTQEPYQNTQEPFQASQEPNPSQEPNGNDPFPLGGKIALAAAAVALIIIGILFATGVFGSGKGTNNSSNAASNASGNVNYSQIIEDKNGSGAQTATDKNGSAIEQANGSSSNSSDKSSSQDASSGESGNSASSKNSSGTASGSTSSGAASDSSSKSSSASSKGNNSDSGIAINGETFKVGDTVTYTAYLSGINTSVAALQGITTYDSDLLEVIDDSFSAPNLTQLVYNTKPKNPDEIKFNAVDVTNGFNFSQEAEFYQVSFVIKQADVTACDIKTEIPEIFDVYYDDIKDYQLTEKVTLAEN